jgi:hypothetical protein
LNERAPCQTHIFVSSSAYKHVNLPSITVNYSAYRSTPVTYISPLLSRSFVLEQEGLVNVFPG